MDRYDRLLIAAIVLALALWGVQACGRPSDSAQGQPSTFVPRMLVGDGLYMWDLGPGRDRCYQSGNTLACVPSIPTRSPLE